jgi:hypothetical protein
VADALHFFRIGDWFSLYKTLEIVRDDVGGTGALQRRHWVSKRQLDRFTHTAQCRDALGDAARHATKTIKPPRQPMCIDDATRLIKSLIQKGLATQ